jgi:23S rRNA G2445 N2-methylase RlmL
VLELAEQDLLRYRPSAPSGLLIANPPYGKRLGRTREVHQLYRAVGAHLRRAFSGWRAALLVPRSVPPALFGLEGAEKVALSNGGVPVQLIVGIAGASAR